MARIRAASRCIVMRIWYTQCQWSSSLYIGLRSFRCGRPKSHPYYGSVPPVIYAILLKFTFHVGISCEAIDLAVVCMNLLINTAQQRTIVQQYGDIGGLGTSSYRSQSPCFVMQIGKVPVDRTFFLNGQASPYSTTSKELGVILSTATLFRVPYCLH